MLQPGRLPDDIGDEIGLPAQRFGDGTRGAVGAVGIRRLDRDDQFARPGEMFLVDFEAGHRGEMGGQQVEHFGIQTQPRESGGNRDQEQQPPPAKPMAVHWNNSPSKVSPVRGFSRRHELAVGRWNCHGAAGWPPASAPGN